jgi:hypothetical protein
LERMGQVRLAGAVEVKRGEKTTDRHEEMKRDNAEVEQEKHLSSWIFPEGTPSRH